MQGRVFLSAVSSEFAQARDRLAADLRARGAFVSVQSDFRSEQADTLLGKLHDYIRDCAQVVCVVGTRSGVCPTVKEAEPFRHDLPVDFTEASYTQWELFLARHFRCHLSVHIAAAICPCTSRLPRCDLSATTPPVPIAPTYRVRSAITWLRRVSTGRNLPRWISFGRGC